MPAPSFQIANVAAQIDENVFQPEYIHARGSD